ncbi:Hypothetical predicted protein [Lecanosticta acicola]|uniref:Uncharacterized protein n=1 Tax=Lecanosticta acicola TaxID=111012 RepID=A0AAI8Z112_9PEZI|nr:Hypothetical predicted protein [Lecanosticta acicola]
MSDGASPAPGLQEGKESVHPQQPPQQPAVSPSPQPDSRRQGRVFDIEVFDCEGIVWNTDRDTNRTDNRIDDRPKLIPRRPVARRRAVQFNQPPIVGGGPLSSHPPFADMGEREMPGAYPPEEDTSHHTAANMSSESNRYTTDSMRSPESPASTQNNIAAPKQRPGSFFRTLSSKMSLQSLRSRTSFSSSRMDVSGHNTSYGDNASTMRPQTPGGISMMSQAGSTMPPPSTRGGKADTLRKKRSTGWFGSKRSNDTGMDAVMDGDQKPDDQVQAPVPKRMKPSPSLPVLPEFEYNGDGSLGITDMDIDKY